MFKLHCKKHASDSFTTQAVDLNSLYLRQVVYENGYFVFYKQMLI